MGKIIVVIGTSGVGKTTLVNALSRTGQFSVGLEEHNKRPFQKLFNENKKFAFENQVDYLLFRAEQEKTLRLNVMPGLIDGGLDLDFFGFSKLFKYRGYLGPSEFQLCKRLYQYLRSSLGEPDFIIHLFAEKMTIEERLHNRNRINIATSQDTFLLEKFIREGLKTYEKSKIINVDVTYEEPGYQVLINNLLHRLTEMNLISNQLFETDYIP